jgi:threonine dehydratase
MALADDITAAEARIRPYVRATPLDLSHAFSQVTGAEVHLKLENLQYTGSFKLRGAMNKLLSLPEEQRARGIVAASSGNHGAAVAFGCHALGVPGVVFVPEDASPVKVAAMQRYGIEVRFHGDDSLLSELEARRHAAVHDLAYVSPYNDAMVVAGQGTIAAELVRQADALDAVFVSVGGGGLIGGIGAYLRAHSPQTRIVGCLPENSPVMAVSQEAGYIVDMPSLPTLSDGTAGGIERDAITFDLCRQVVDEYVLVDEAEIAAAMRLVMEAHHLLVEGAAGVAVAGLLRRQADWRGKRVAVVLCGANIGLGTLKTILP